MEHKINLKRHTAVELCALRLISLNETLDDGCNAIYLLVVQFLQVFNKLVQSVKNRLPENRQAAYCLLYFNHL